MPRAQFTLTLALALLPLSARAQAPAAPSAATQTPVKGCGPHCETLGSPSSAVTVIFLHGASGSASYYKMAQRLAEGGVYVLYPRYLEVRSSHGASDTDYAAWAAFVDGIARQTTTARPGHPVVAFGISLGASVALAAGVENPFITAVVDWSGSLPDTAFQNGTRVPPLLILHGSDDPQIPVRNAEQLVQLCQAAGQQCESEIYKGDGHVFPNHHDDAWQRTFTFLRTVGDGHAPPARDMPEF